MYLNQKHLFLAGATGLAGSAIIQHIMDSFPKTSLRAVYQTTQPFLHPHQITYIQGDLRDKEVCRQLLAGCDCAILAAANTSGAHVLKHQPWQQINDNLILNANLLEACYFSGIKRVIFISSASVYQPLTGSIQEDALDLNQDPHPAHFGIGWVMRYLEKLCQFWHQQVGMEIAIVRAANIFGPFDKFAPETSHFIPAIIRKAVDRMDPFEVWGQADVSRDVIFSADLATAIVKLMNQTDIHFQTFNLGSGIKTTVADVVKWALKYAEHEPSEICYRSDKPTTIQSRLLDCTRIQQQLGWQPTYTIEAAIQKTTEWWKRNRSWWKK